VPHLHDPRRDALPRLPGGEIDVVTAVLATVPVAPLLAAPSLRSELVSQLVLGEGAVVAERDGDMLRVTTALDSYDGWIHRGYVLEVDVGTLDRWLGTADWSEGAELALGPATLRAPHRARVAVGAGGQVRLPDGRGATIRAGSIRPWGEVIRDAAQLSPADWAWRAFAGAPYLWGGVTAAGIDCSGLVQTTFLARGVPLPRDAREQVHVGASVPADAVEDGDLLFFHGAGTERITHVAIAARAGEIVHSTIETGTVTRERFAPGTRAEALRERLVAVRRLT
jgi:hypothetical protein